MANAAAKHRNSVSRVLRVLPRPQPLRVLPQQQQGFQLRHRIDPLGEELQDAGGNLR
jgi:hypothetical protein